MTDFKKAILEGMPSALPPKKEYDVKANHAPKRKAILSTEEKKLALRNALRYVDTKYHKELAPEFAQELEDYGRIYMYRFRPDYEMYARNIEEYPHKTKQAASIMLMIHNNLDPAVAQHPQELITYGGNGAVFQNWAQYRITMKYLAEMTDEQTLAMYSGHPMGLFPSHKDAPRVVVTNGMTIPNYSKPDDWEKFNALGVSQYGQMTAGSFMYIGPQGIVHGTTITLLNAGRKISKQGEGLEGKIFITSGLGGMSGAQPKAGNIAGVVSVTAEINPQAAYKRQEQNWVDEVIEDVDKVIDVALEWKEKKQAHSIAYLGNIVDLWERIVERDVHIDLGSDQTSLHNPWAGGYYPVGISYEDANKMMVEQPEEFKKLVQESLKRQVKAINIIASKGMYFFDYGNAFLLESSRAEADILKENGDFLYSSYVQDIMGPMCFDYGFGPFRWVCTSGKEEDLDTTDKIAMQVLEEIATTAPQEIMQQMKDNIRWISEAKKNNLVVGSQARILYADCEGRTKIAAAFNITMFQEQILLTEKLQIFMMAHSLQQIWQYKM